MIHRQIIPLLLSATIALAGGTQSCQAEGKPGKAQQAAYAGDGVTRFTDTGKLKWDTGYAAHAIDKTDRQNCRWAVYTVNADGEARVIKSGTYRNASIKAERPTRVKVYLKSSECGDWRPR